MVIVLQGNPVKRSKWGSAGSALGLGLGQGMEKAQQTKEDANKLEKRRQAASEYLGMDLPQGMGEQELYEIVKQAAKYKQQQQMIESLGLGGLGEPQETESPTSGLVQPRKTKDTLSHEYGGSQGNLKQNVGEYPEEINVKIPTEKKLNLYSQEDINKMALVNPAVSDKMQRYNDNALKESRHRETTHKEDVRHHEKQVSESYKENKEYINKTYDQYEDSLRKESLLDKQGELEESGELSDSGIINLLETMGLKSEWLKNPANEEYMKLALDQLGGGSLQADYGSRVLQSEFKVSMQRIATLSQTPEGRRQIRENIKAMLLPSKLKQERLQYYLDKQERTGEPLPHNLRGRVLKDIKPQLEEAYDKFKQRNGRYKVKEGTFPDDNVLEKYFYIAGSNEEKALKMMKEDGYDIE